MSYPDQFYAAELSRRVLDMENSGSGVLGSWPYLYIFDAGERVLSALVGVAYNLTQERARRAVDLVSERHQRAVDAADDAEMCRLAEAETALAKRLLGRLARAKDEAWERHAGELWDPYDFDGLWVEMCDDRREQRMVDRYEWRRS